MLIVINRISSAITIKKKVTFNFYIDRIVKNSDAYGHFTVIVNVIDLLKLNILIGINFILEHGVKIDFV
jgi:hypothetical protein